MDTVSQEVKQKSGFNILASVSHSWRTVWVYYFMFTVDILLYIILLYSIIIIRYYSIESILYGNYYFYSTVLLQPVMQIRIRTDRNHSAWIRILL